MSKATQSEENGAVPTETGFRLLFTIFSTMFSRPKSLRSKLAHWNALVLLLTLLLLEVIVYQMVTYRMIYDLDARLQTQGSRLETQTRQWQASGTASDIAFFHQLVRGQPINEFTTNSIYIKLFDKQTGRILAGRAPLSSEIGGEA